MLNVSFHGNEILNFNRGINRVFHSHSFFTSHAKLLVFLRILRRVPPRFERTNENERSRRELERSLRAAVNVRLRNVVSVFNWKERGTMERRENFGHLSCLY